MQQGLAGFPVALLDAGDYLTRHHRKYVSVCVAGGGWLEGSGRGEVAKNGVWWGGGWVVEVGKWIEEGVEGGLRWWVLEWKEGRCQSCLFRSCDL